MNGLMSTSKISADQLELDCYRKNPFRSTFRVVFRKRTLLGKVEKFLQKQPWQNTNFYITFKNYSTLLSPPNKRTF